MNGLFELIGLINNEHLIVVLLIWWFIESDVELKLQLLASGMSMSFISIRNGEDLSSSFDILNGLIVGLDSRWRHYCCNRPLVADNATDG